MGAEERKARRESRRSLAPAAPVISANLFAEVVPDTGVVGRYIFPGAGTVLGASAFSDEFSGNTLKLYIEARQPEGLAHNLSFEIGKKGLNADIGIEVVSGTRLTVRAEPGAKGVHVGLLWRLR